MAHVDHPERREEEREGMPPVGRVRSVPDRLSWVEKAWSRLQLNFTGIVVATLFFALSVTPSLLPRDWLFQGMVSGGMSAAGYGIGVLLAWIFRRWVQPRLTLPTPTPVVTTTAKVSIVVLAVVISIVMLTFAAGWQRELEAAMGLEETATTAYLRTLGLSLLVAAFIVVSSRVLRLWSRWTADQLGSRVRIPSPIATFLGGVLIGVLIITLVNGLLIRGFFAASNWAFGVRNDGEKPGVAQPEAMQRTGSPDSLIPWETLGRQGRAFVSGGLSQSGLVEESGDRALEPIRVYVGVESASDPQVQAALALAELRRTGAFQRSVLAIITTTGTGWVNETAAQSLELMYRGDTAIVSTQYSFLPSAFSFLGDREKVATAAQTLFDTIYEFWETQRAGERPRLLVYGESLGSMGSETIFDGLADIRDRVDGALWVGPPYPNQLSSQFIERRDPGSLAIAPRYADGLIVRFASRAAELRDTETDEWLPPRILYLRHPTDPVVWWSPDLLFNRPDWLAESRDGSLFPHMRWWPLVTFAQVSADLTNANSAPVGFGHNYGSLVLDGWAAVAPPPGWSSADTEATRKILDEVVPEALARP